MTLAGLLVAYVALSALPFGAGAAADDATCRAVDNRQPYCGFRGPEDLAALPGEEALLVSEYVSAGFPGHLSVLVIDSGERRVIYQAGQGGTAVSGWGEATCQTPPQGQFHPHGLSLRRRVDGALMLAVVQHAERESIELFEVEGAGTDWAVAWRGCILAPAGMAFNDVSLFDDGRLVATQTETTPEFAAAVYHWSPGNGFDELAFTRGDYPNGVHLAQGDQSVFVNYFMGGQVRRYNLASGEVEAMAEIPGLDNITLVDDDGIVVASFRHLAAQSIDEVAKAFNACFEAKVGACPMPFAIIRLDGDLENQRVLYAGGDTLMGAGTVGLVIGDQLFIGSVAGDRILGVTLPRDPAPEPN